MSVPTVSTSTGTTAKGEHNEPQKSQIGKELAEHFGGISQQ
jgi:hypothetical protein